MESLLALVQQWVSSGSLTLAAGGAFVGGALTAMNPCVLVMVPLLISLIWSLCSTAVRPTGVVRAL